MANNKTLGYLYHQLPHISFFKTFKELCMIVTFVPSKKVELSSGQRMGVVLLIPKKTKITEILSLGDRSLFWQQIVMYWPKLWLQDCKK